MTKPKYLRALEYFAAKRGVTPEEFLASVREARARWPGPDCLEPHEIAVAVESPATLRPERAAHLAQCPECRACVTAGSYSEDGSSGFSS